MHPDDMLTLVLRVNPYYDYLDRLTPMFGYRDRRSHGYRPMRQGYECKHGMPGNRLPVVLRRKPRNRSRNLRKSLARRFR